MDRTKKRFVTLLVPVALILFASFLAAQGPPNPCANACWEAYRNAVIACHGDATCLAKARAAAEACVQGCGLPPR
jgi:hypothetical protein